VIESDQPELLSLAELTAAAAEAGIDVRALQAAVAEHERRKIREPARLLSLPSVLSRSVQLGAGLGFVNAGLVQVFADSSATASLLTTATMFAALVISGSFSGAEREAPRSQRLVRFEVRTLGLFGGLGAALLAFFSVVSPHAIPEMMLSRFLAGLGLFWLFSSTFGGAVTLTRTADSSQGEGPGSGGDDQLSIFARARRSLARQLKRWSDLLLRYSHVAPDQPRA
jgi:hypothetical protein